MCMCFSFRHGHVAINSERVMYNHFLGKRNTNMLIFIQLKPFHRARCYTFKRPDGHFGESLRILVMMNLFNVNASKNIESNILIPIDQFLNGYIIETLAKAEGMQGQHW